MWIDLLELIAQDLNKLYEGDSQLSTGDSVVEKSHRTLFLFVQVGKGVIANIQRLHKVCSIHPGRQKIELYGPCAGNSCPLIWRHPELMRTWHERRLSMRPATRIR